MAKTVKTNQLPVVNDLTGAKVIGLDKDGKDAQFPLQDIVRSERGVATPAGSPTGTRFAGETWTVSTANLDVAYPNWGGLSVPSKVGEKYTTNNRFVWNNGAWTLERELVDISSGAIKIDDITKTYGINLANPANIIPGKEYNSANKVIQTPPSGQDSVYKGPASSGNTYSISGLPTSPNSRFGAFFNANGVFIEGSGFTIPANATFLAGIVAPGGTVEIVTSLQGRDPAATDFSKFQIQEGPITTYSPFTEVASGLKSLKLSASFVEKSTPTAAMEAVGLGFLNLQLAGKVSAQAGAGLYPDADKTKVSGLTITGYQRGVNLANPANIVLGKEVYNAGGFQEVRNRADDSVIYIRNIPAGTYTFSGLPVDGTTISRAFFILGSADQIIRAGSIFGTVGQITLTFAAGETGFVSSLQGRSASRNDLSVLMFAPGSTPVPFVPYFETPVYGMAVSKLINPKITQTDELSNDSPITKKYFDDNAAAIVPKTKGKVAVIFADSIGETTSTTGPRDNWPNYAFPMMQATFQNFARSGATYKDRTPLADPRQIISQQITDAIASGVTPDFVICGLGTNDGLVNIGDYNTAIGKGTLENLDRTNLYEALRWAYWKIKVTWNVPLYVLLPLQRADAEPETLEPMYQAIRKMAGRYGAIIIDCTHESGIVRDFEIDGSAGRDLYDGLHPAVSGRQKQAKLIANRIMATYQP